MTATAGKPIAPDPGAEPADPGDESLDRPALVARWLDLTRRRLPAAAGPNGWPISLDHCFMRVCLDVAFGQPWHQVVARPAIRHASDRDLARAVCIAEGVLAYPETLPELNRRSLAFRGFNARAGQEPLPR